jgi:actin-related protein 9
VSQHLHARVGLHKNSSGTAGANDYIVGAALDDALAAGQDLLVSYPFAEGTIRDWAQAEALW